MSNTKKVKFDIDEDGDEDRTTISINGIGEVILVQTYPEYEFLEDIGEEGLEEINVQEGDLIGKIEHLEIEDEYKGQGYAKLLMEKAIEVAKEKGLMPLYLNASPMGSKRYGLNIEYLTGFYKGLGFEVFLRQGGNNLMILKNTYKNGGLTKNNMENKIKFSKEEHKDFNFWKQDGNVSKNEDGSYSTQDAQWTNRLKDLDALKQYYYKEFLSDNRYAGGGEAGFDDTNTSMVIYHEEKGNFMFPKDLIYLWLYEGENASEKIESQEYDWVLYPSSSISMMGHRGFIPPLKKIWTKKFQKQNKGSEHLLGVIKAHLLNDGKELYIDMMSVNPTKKKKGVMSYMIKDLRDTFNLTQDQVTFSNLTEEGKKFIEKKTYADGGVLKVGSKVGFLRPRTGRYEYAEVLSIDGDNVNLVVRHPKRSQWDNYFTETMERITKFSNTLSEDYDRPVMKVKFDDGGELEENPNRNETQENNFGVTYKLGDKFSLGRNFDNKDTEVSIITEIMPSGLFFKVDKSSKIFSVKSLKSRGTTYTSGEYLVPIKKEYTNGGVVIYKETDLNRRDEKTKIVQVTTLDSYREALERIEELKKNNKNPNVRFFTGNIYADGGGVEKSIRGFKVGDLFYITPSTSGNKRYYKITSIDNYYVKADDYDYVLNGTDVNTGRKSSFTTGSFGFMFDEHEISRYEKGDLGYAKGGDIPHEDKMFQLPLEMVVYVPSTQDVDKVISVDKMVTRVDEVKEYLASKFGGYTSSDKLGGYVDSTGNLVNEDVVQVTSFSTQEAYSEHKEELIQQLAKWGKQWGQEAIGFEFEGDLMYVPQELKNETKVDEYRRGGFMYEVQKIGSPSNDMRETMFTAKNLTELKKKIIEKYGTSEGFMVSRRTEQGYYAPVKFENGGDTEENKSLTRGEIENKIAGLKLRIAKTKKQISGHQGGKYNNLWEQKVVPLQKELTSLSELWGNANYKNGGAIYPDLSLQKADVVNDSVVLDEFEIKKTKNTFQINGLESLKITHSGDSVKILRELFEKDTMSAYEQAVILYLNKNNKVIGYYNHSSGGIDGTIMDVEMISGMALKSLSKGVIIAHNHPSENTMPSDADKRITKQLDEALRLFNIQLLDSLILTENSYLSFIDEGLIF